MAAEPGRLVPAKDCFVAHREAGRYDGRLGVVLQSDNDAGRVQVMWGGSGDKEWRRADELQNGFRPGHTVQDRPRSNIRITLGTGSVVAHRRIGGREMVLVQLHRTGESRWLPFERLVRVRDAEWKYLNAAADDPELFRLKALAYALDSWNQITGALDRLDVDPLPHQIDLVHRIMTSDHTNWLIADDAGLGKTIEVGLLLAAMKRRRQARRVLVVCPAGVVRQWQDEMRYKFGEDFRIYGLDGLTDLADSIATSATGADPFFANEIQMLDELCAAARDVKADDQKLSAFLAAIVDPVRGSDLKLLIFTEYRATQDYLVDALLYRYPGSGVCQINGGMSLTEKQRNIDAFNDSAQFMVSTEAGGEGINLHYNCHTLVNYDLPWNPRRLVQRAGRLYRYGQTERVAVFNLVARDGFDNRALGMLLDRVTTIAHDMSDVSPEFHAGLEAEILGELLERVDIAELLASNRELEIDDRSEAEIEQAIEGAERSRSMQDQLFSHIEGYDPNTTAALHTFGPEEVMSFLDGVLPRRGIQIRDRLHHGRLLELELPEEMRGRYSEFGGRTIVRITVDRRLALRDERNVVMDFASVFFSDLIEFAKSPEFGGEHASLMSSQEGVLGIFKIRWQNDQGLPRWEMLVPIFLPSDGGPAVPNPDFFGSLLHGAGYSGSARLAPGADERRRLLSRLQECAAAELAARCTEHRHPNDLVLLGTADLWNS